MKRHCCERHCFERAGAEGRRRYTWAELLRRVFALEVFVCPNCGGTRRLLAAFHDQEAIERVLRAMGLSAAPEMAAARSPPVQTELPW